MAINDVLPLKAALREAIANLKCFGASDTRDLISIVTFTFTVRRHLIRLASAPFISTRLATFGWVRFPCATREKHNAEFTKGGRELWSHFKPFMNQSSRHFRRCRKTLIPFNALFRLSMSRFVQKIIAIKSRSRRKTEQLQTFCGLPIIVGRTAPTFLRQFVRATYYPLLDKVWLSSVC